MKQTNYPNEPFYIEDISGETNFINFYVDDNVFNINEILYSTDGEIWNEKKCFNEQITSIKIEPYGRVYIKCLWTLFPIKTIISCTKKHNIGGVLYGQYGFKFTDDSNLVNAEDLIIYDSFNCEMMFFGCISLKTPPKLTATKLYSRCYEYMFGGCIELETAPELQQLILMFFAIMVCLVDV